MVLRTVLGVGALAWVALPSVARGDENSVPDHDARLDGYVENVILSGGGAVVYLAFVLVAAIPVAVMFMDAKRSHLD
jgi:hypothetical protein